MPNIIDILARALSLRQETELNSITPNRAGGIMYDTLLVLNQMQLDGGALLISKVYASVAAMEADTTPTSDLTGRALKPGQLVVIVTTDTSSDMGSEYRYNGPGSWTYVGKVGGLPFDTVPIQNSTRGITSGAVYNALIAMSSDGYKYMGIATPGDEGTTPGTPHQPVFYVAGPGSYPNFGNLTVAAGYLGFFKYSSGSWSVDSVAVGKDYDSQLSTIEGQITQLEAELADIPINILEYPTTSWFVNSAGVWSGYGKNVLIPITPGQAYKIVGGANAATYIDVLAEGLPSSSRAAVFATGYDARVEVGVGETYYFVAPNDAQNLLVMVENANGDDRAPSVSYGKVDDIYKQIQKVGNNADKLDENFSPMYGRGIPFALGAINGLSGSTLDYLASTNRVRIDLPLRNVASVFVKDSGYKISSAALYNGSIPTTSFANLASALIDSGVGIVITPQQASSYERIVVCLKKTDDSDLSSLTSVDGIVSIETREGLIPNEAPSRKFQLIGGFLSTTTGTYPASTSYFVGYAHTPRFIRLRGVVTIKTRNLEGRVLFYDNNQTFLSYVTFSTASADYHILPPTGAALFRIAVNSSGLTPASILLSGFWTGDDEEFQRLPSDSGYQNVTAVVKVASSVLPSSEASEITPQYQFSTDSGVLHLPSTYSEKGNPVPLIIYLHGSGSKYGVTSNRFDENNPYAPEWDAAGYAQMDVDMIPDLYNQNVQSPSGSGDDYECVLAAYEWAIAHFNIRRDGVYLLGRSRGAQAVLTILGKYDPARLPIVCALSNCGANSIIDYVIYTPLYGTSDRWTLFCNSHGLPSEGRPAYGSGSFVSQPTLAQFLRDNIALWWGKAMSGLWLLKKDGGQYDTPTDIFDLIVSSYNAANSGKDFCDWIRTCKFRSPVPLRFDWCKNDTIQDWDADSWGNYSSSLKDAFLATLNGNAIYREWPTTPDNPSKNPHYHEVLNFLDGDYILPNGAVVTDPSMARIEWLLWCQRNDPRFSGSVQPRVDE